MENDNPTFLDMTVKCNVKSIIPKYIDQEIIFEINLDKNNYKWLKETLDNGGTQVYESRQDETKVRVRIRAERA